MSQNENEEVREIVSEWASKPRHSSGQYLAEIGSVLGISPASPKRISHLDKATVIGKMLNLDFKDKSWEEKADEYSLVLIPAKTDVFHDDKGDK